MANWVRCPLPLFWAFPPWRACEVEVQYPPSKGVSQRYLRDTLWKQGKWVRYPPLRYADTISKRYSRYGGVSRTGPLRSWVFSSQGQDSRGPWPMCRSGRIKHAHQIVVAILRRLRAPCPQGELAIFRYRKPPFSAGSPTLSTGSPVWIHCCPLPGNRGQNVMRNGGHQFGACLTLVATRKSFRSGSWSWSLSLKEY